MGSTGEGAQSVRAYDVWIIELHVPLKRSLLLQAWLLGEEGLGVMRSFDADRCKQQFWTTVCQRDEAHQWLKSLPENFEVTGEWLWQDDIKKAGS